MSIEVMKQALEALEQVKPLYDKHHAITALRKAIEQAEKQEPVAFVTGTYAGRFVVKPLNPAMVLPVNMALYTTPPAALMQEPVAWVCNHYEAGVKNDVDYYQDDIDALPVGTMLYTTPQPQQAEKRTTEFSAQTKRNIEFMKQFENKENQEPMEVPAIKFAQVADGIEVGYDLFGGVDIRLGGEFVYVHINYDYKYTDNATRTLLANDIVRLLTTPQPQREWVGLTDEEMHECWDSPLTRLGMKHARMIEAKLKQKNGYAEEKNT